MEVGLSTEDAAWDAKFKGEQSLLAFPCCQLTGPARTHWTATPRPVFRVRGRLLRYGTRRDQ
jgi:hypothetical protein